MVAFLSAGGCTRTPARTSEKVAILRFDNLSGDATLDWISNAATEILASQLTGSPHVLAVRAPSISEGYAAGATRVVHGSFDSRTSFHVSIEDVATHKMVDATDIQAPPLPAMDRVAHLISPQAVSFSGANDRAIEAWASGNYEQAVAADPSFSAAWLAWVQQLAARKENQKALDVATQALAQPLHSPIDRAQIESLVAALHDDIPARVKTLEKLTSLIPLDPQLWDSLATAQMSARSFPGAAMAYRKVVELQPTLPLAYNLLGYAQAFAGDMEAAKKTFAQYGNFPNQATNSLDSLGECYFAAGEFAQAEQAFLSSYNKDPNFTGGLALLKAAYSKWFGGNHDGADQTMKEFLIARVKQHDPLTMWREAVWLYSTGREAQAQSALEIAIRDDPKQVQPIVRNQLAIWKNPGGLPKDPAVLKQIYDHTPPPQDGLIRTFYAAALLAAGKKDEARKLTMRWPIPESGGDPLVQGFLYPKFLEVRSALQ